MVCPICDRIAQRFQKGGHGHACGLDSIHRTPAGGGAPGCLLESPVSQVPRLHRPGPHWAGRGRVETFSLFPGLTLSHLCFQSETFSHRHAALDSGLEITHCPPGAGGLGDEGGAHPLSGPRGSLSAPHGLLRPLHPPLSPGILRGLLHLPEPGHPVPGFAARLGPGRRLPPGNSAAVLSPGPPHVSPRADRAGPYFLSALRPAGSPSACLTTR